ncbi:MAG: hypothetical protein M9938_00535 [Solirubrobacterales bacterium]|nr:hypothetical protein [Solirubrobacterales bacterium]
MSSTPTEIGFEGGQVLPVQLSDDQVKALRKALKTGESPHEIETESGSLLLDLGKVIFVRFNSADRTVGF